MPLRRSEQIAFSQQIISLTFSYDPRQLQIWRWTFVYSFIVLEHWHSSVRYTLHRRNTTTKYYWNFSTIRKNIRGYENQTALLIFVSFVYVFFWLYFKPACVVIRLWLVRIENGVKKKQRHQNFICVSFLVELINFLLQSMEFVRIGAYLWPNNSAKGCDCQLVFFPRILCHLPLRSDKMTYFAFTHIAIESLFGCGSLVSNKTFRRFFLLS